MAMVRGAMQKWRGSGKGYCRVPLVTDLPPFISKPTIAWATRLLCHQNREF